MKDQPHNTTTSSRSNYLLIAMAAAVVLAVYLVGKTTPRLSFQPVGADWFGEWLVWLFAAALFALMLLGPARSRTTPQRRTVLIALRLAVIVLVILMMLRPVLVYWASSQRPAVIPILVDVSGSMKAPDVGGSRYGRLKKTLADAQGRLAALAEDLEIKFYAFDADLRELKFSGGKVQLPDSPEGDQTAIGSGIRDTFKRHANNRHPALILLSDGSQRALAPRDENPSNVVRRLKGVKIHTVIFGNTQGQTTQRDVVLQTLQANQAVHVKNRLAIDGEAVLMNLANKKIPAHVQWETRPGVLETVETTQVQTGPANRVVPFKTGYAPQVPGLYRLRLRLADWPGELDADNNYQDTIVRVLKGGLKVLYLESGPRLEARGLRRSLGSAPNIEVDYLRLPAPTAVGDDPAPRGPAMRRAMAEAFQPGKYDVYMLGNLPASAFLTGAKAEDAELYKLRERVRAGAGLIMLGGMFSFGPGGYGGERGKTPLEEVLPVKMSLNELQNPGEPLRRDLHLLEPVRLRPAPRAKGNFLVLLTTPERNAAAWAELPPLLNGANKLEVRTGNVLLEDEQRNPMLIAGTYGAGRVLAFAGDSTWRWVSHGKEEQHKRFWRQLVLWLGRKDQEDGGRVWVNAKQRNVFVGQRVELAAGARTPDLQPLADFEMSAMLIRRDESFKELSRTEFKFNRQGELRTRSYKPTEPGDYTIEVRAFQNGKLLGTATERFLVRAAKQLEMQRPVPDAETMNDLARQTGGLAVSPKDFHKILDELARIPAQLTEKTEIISSLWDPLRAGPFTFLGLDIYLAGLLGFAVAALLGVEWYLRKRWGLV